MSIDVPEVDDELEDSDLDNAGEEVDSEGIDDDEAYNLDDIISGYNLEFVIEDRPKQDRQGRPKREAVPWEQVLENIKLEAPGQDIRIREMPVSERAEAKARSLAREIRIRLFAATPTDLWSVTHRRDPNTGTWKVYVKYERVLTQAETNERIQKRVDAAKRMAAGRKAVQGS